MQIQPRKFPSQELKKPAVVLLSDNMETDSGAWLLRGPWARVEVPGSGLAYHDSPGDTYVPDANVRLVTKPLRLDVEEPVLQFRLAHDTEAGADPVTVEIAENHEHVRHDWHELARSDGHSDWTENSISLSGWEGKEVQIRFRLTSDGQNQLAGLWIDDVVIGGSAPLTPPAP